MVDEAYHERSGCLRQPRSGIPEGGYGFPMCAEPMDADTEAEVKPPADRLVDGFGSHRSSSGSGRSMNLQVNRMSSPGSPVKAEHESSPASAPTAQIGRLSIDNDAPLPSSSRTRTTRGRGMLAAATSSAPSKRSASTELSRPQAGQLTTSSHVRGALRSPASQVSARRGINPRNRHSRRFHSDLKHSSANFNFHHKAFGRQPHRDSGYETGPSRQNTNQHSLSGALTPSDSISGVNNNEGLIRLPPHSRYPGLILQPDSSPISQDQLAAEVKGIYAGLVMVEAKCINIDAAEASNPKSQLNPEQWQALIALHRTLLYEHHDFLMATQHPSATMALRGLATKYNMPARMWKHGIHAFLEVLRHRRPESQDYMLAFIYLAYQMMALLFETVPSFTDTWIECLGDLARYRMAIEEEKEAHATWGGVAARWYTMASDRHPAIGRLYHHLGILERPSLRKFCLYAKSLTCVIPFPNARDSLSTLCGPIVQNKQTIENSSQLAEARTVTFHALVYSDAKQETIEAVGSDALRLLRQQLPKLKDIGAYLGIANVAAMFELGSTKNMLWQLYATAINKAMQSARPSMSNAVASSTDVDQLRETYATTMLSSSLLITIDFCYSTFNTIIRGYEEAAMLRTCLPFVHICLTWFHSLHALRGRLNEYAHNNPFDSFIESERVSWRGLADFLNALITLEPVSSRTMECARQGVFLASERKEDAWPLTEDYLIRGLIWGQFYFSPGWFDGQTEDDGRTIETKATQKSRVERVTWLGLFMAFHTEYLSYDVQKRLFSPGLDGPSKPGCLVASLALDREAGIATTFKSDPVAITDSLSPRSVERSSSSHSEDGFVHVQAPRTHSSINSPAHSMNTRRSSRSWATTGATGPPSKVSKQEYDMNTFKVVDDDNMDYMGETDTYG